MLKTDERQQELRSVSGHDTIRHFDEHQGKALVAVQKEKQRIRQELDSHRAVREQLTKQQREMKTKCEYMTVDQVDDAITRLETRMAHTSLSLNEEKKSMEDIKRLKVELYPGLSIRATQAWIASDLLPLQHRVASGNLRCPAACSQ